MRALAAAVLIVTTGAVPAVGRGVASVKRELATIEDLLRAGEWQAARDSSDEVLLGLVKKAVQGREGRELFGAALALRAIAAAGLGDAQAATWDWTAAEEISPAAPTLDKADFGAAGRTLEDSLFRLPVVMRIEQGPDGKLRIEPPRKLSGARPGDSKLGRAVRSEGAVGLGIVIDEAGNPVAVRNLAEKELDERTATLVATLDAVRSWRFQPATLDGSPVGVVLDYGFTWR